MNENKCKNCKHLKYYDQLLGFGGYNCEYAELDLVYLPPNTEYPDIKNSREDAIWFSRRGTLFCNLSGICGYFEKKSVAVAVTKWLVFLVTVYLLFKYLI